MRHAPWQSEVAFVTIALWAWLIPAIADSQDRPRAEVKHAARNLVPLNEMSASDRYQGQDGGLYGAGENRPPEAHRRAAEAELARIRPLDKNGNPSPDGRVVFISLSMSNATQEFSTFKQIADRDPRKSPRLRACESLVDRKSRPSFSAFKLYQDTKNCDENAKTAYQN